MPTGSTLAWFALAALALLVVPGPAVLYIVSRSVNQGRRAGLVSVAGIHTGSVVHVLAAALGVSALLATSAGAFTVVKLLGAAYLIALGVLRLTRRHRPAAEAAPADASMRRIYVHGVIVNVLNPKTALFFLAFLPQFVDPRRGPVALQILFLGLCFIGLGLGSDATYALVASSLGQRWRASERFGQVQDRVSGLIYIGLGVAAGLTGHRPPTRSTRLSARLT
jgi:threonine/homoserine/homoserine lactone efflux protein